jgi:hypothetical protein
MPKVVIFAYIYRIHLKHFHQSFRRLYDNIVEQGTLSFFFSTTLQEQLLFNYRLTFLKILQSTDHIFLSLTNI